MARNRPPDLKPANLMMIARPGEDYDRDRTESSVRSAADDEKDQRHAGYMSPATVGWRTGLAARRCVSLARHSTTTNEQTAVLQRWCGKQNPKNAGIDVERRKELGVASTR